MIQIYDSLSRKKKQLAKSQKTLKIFVCGPTVYDLAHIGNARTYIAFDIIVRWLRRQKYNIIYLQNITDVDDKIIAGAREARKSPIALAREFEREYLKDMKALGVTSVDKYARATEHISQIEVQIKKLLKKKHAYRIENDGYYFDLKSFADYGKLSGRSALQAEDSVSRIDESTQKRNRGDFCLWKFPHGETPNVPKNYDKKNPPYYIVDGEPIWYTELGWGRPGWHIEDTAISETRFGPQYDIHGGGIDLKFPHHEAEIAQQEAASGKKPFVGIWMHAGFLLVEGAKMSKSLGNFLTIRDFLKENSADVFRMLVAGVHYRSPLNYTKDSVEQAKNTLTHIRETLDRLTSIQQLRALRPSGGAKKTALLTSTETAHIIRDFHVEFSSAMNDDFNTPVALASVFKFISAIENKFGKLSPATAKKIQKEIAGVFQTFGITINTSRLPKNIVLLVKERELARKKQDWKASDELRNELLTQGYKVEDTGQGPIVIPRQK